MNYIITANTSTWPKLSRAMPYSDLAERVGRIKIDFSTGSASRSFENEYTNIPLFLTEMDLFLSRLDNSRFHRWYLNFSPFSYGILKNESLYISTRAGKYFDDGVYDITPEDELDRLKTRVSKDISRYGKVLLEPDKS
ncbi:hypothetical protein [Sphingomonas sp. ABOLE]|uniref:hypothetical protein n=1 Tax=Sphingomonas sp. ABOLE TaxID=1985878 RepID=UPI000F7ECC0B|nr:hypothetical protein [Sphingomonas sp. ABOLE]